MIRAMTLIAAATAVAAASQAGRSSAAPNTERAVIHFADLNGIRDWRPAADDDSDSIFVEGRNGQWFRATFWMPCPDIHFVPAVGFVTDTLGNLDRFTSIIVDGKRCYFKTFERTTEPED
jgi:hypothetical protein